MASILDNSSFRVAGKCCTGDQVSDETDGQNPSTVHLNQQYLASMRSFYTHVFFVIYFGIVPWEFYIKVPKAQFFQDSLLRIYPLMSVHRIQNPDIWKLTLIIW